MLASAKPDGAERSSEWTEVLGGERLTGALLDRLTHHVHILEVNGESYRLAQSKEGSVATLRSRPGQVQTAAWRDGGERPR